MIILSYDRILQLEEIGLEEGVDRIHLAQDRDKW
jgi:hypothetical protein